MDEDRTRALHPRRAPRRRTALAFVAALSLAAAGRAVAQTPAAAPTEEAKPVNTGHLSISIGVDWASAYFFRGIKQETEDLILQPYGELTLKLVENAGALTSLSLTAGIWNSLHTGATGSDGDDIQVIGTLGLAFTY